MKTKVCTKCRESKALSEYYKDGRFGLKAACKKCKAAKGKKYYEANKEKMAAQNKKWYEANKEKVAAKRKKWYEANKEKMAAVYKKYREANKEKVAAYGKKWREANKEKVAAWHKKHREENKEKVAAGQKKYKAENKEKTAAVYKKWCEANKEKLVAKSAKRKARKAGNGGSFTAQEWKDLKKLYGYKCLCCGEKKKLQADHVIPVSWEGGTSNIDNIQPLCGPCNSSKGNHHATDYRL